MVSSSDLQHVYARTVAGTENDSLSLVASRIGQGHTVLDLGMGTGGLGKHLAKLEGVVFDGVTISAQEAQLAKPYYRKVVEVDLDTPDWSAHFDGQKYDRIVCADVLEHLKYPAQLLEQCRHLLKPGGCLIASVPNMGHCGLLAELLNGDFRYRPEGLLDSTHLRFFTRLSLDRFYRENGWRVTQARVTTRDLNSTEFKPAFDRLPPGVTRYLLAMPDALTYQFVDTLEPTPVADDFVPSHMGQVSVAAKPLFSAQLYLGLNGAYAESNKLIDVAEMGQDAQSLRFDLPPLDAAADRYTSLRLDLADRPGWMRLLALRVRVQKMEVWRWSGLTDTAENLRQARHNDVFWGTPPSDEPGVWLLLLGNDPWIELPLPPEVLFALTQYGGSIEATVVAPLSADFLSAMESVKAAELLRVQEAEMHQQNTLRLQEQHQVELDKLRQENLDLMVHSNQTKVEFEGLLAYVQRLEGARWFRYGRALSEFKQRWTPKVSRQELTPAPSGMNEAPAAMRVNEGDNAVPLAVDVIVPVYRGLEDTQRCIRSVLDSECKCDWHLVIINDCSPEPEITQWLREIASQEPKITLLENEVNLGFVATVNRGMQLHPDKDVLLLNSDTEVANDWLDRIQRGAYAQSRVATVTPFSNNATICSYPGFCKSNDLPDGWDTARLDRLCSEHLTGQSVAVPTGVGFCMYIRRACLDVVGLFDVENFGKGYGEENDFCIRAEKAGWKNLHLLDTFVRHAGGVSFGDSKNEREMAAMQTIRRLHPSYESAVHAYVQKDPARLARATLDLARIVSGSKKVVLNVMHNRSGGTVRHLNEMAKALAEQVIFLTLTPENGGLKLRIHGQYEAFALHWQGHFEDIWQAMLETVRKLAVSHVHYHHLLDHHPRMMTLHTHLGVPHDFTVHDYFSYCPQITLTDPTDRYCGERGVAQCQSCLAKRPAPRGEDIYSWRSRYADLLTSARFVICPSLDTARRIQAFVPAANVVTASHVQLQPKSTFPEPTPVARPSDRPLKVVLLGGMAKIKGADVLEAVASLAAQRNLPIEFHLLGYSYRALKTQPKARLTVHGPYEDNDLPSLLAWLEPDMAWFPALCPETFSYTLSSCLEAGLPVMAADLGALAERLNQRPWSWLIHWESTPEQWLDALLNARQQLIESAPPPLPMAELVGPSSTFDYVHEYLDGAAVKSGSSVPELLQSVSQWLGPIKENASPFSRSKFLRLLYWLRGLPLLSVLGRSIPSHWQRQVKSMLTR